METKEKNQKETFSLPRGKAYKGATYKQYQLLCSLGVTIPVNPTQFQKRCPIGLASEAIDLALNGYEVEFTD